MRERGQKNIAAGERTFFGLDRNVFFAGLVSFFMDVSSEMIYPLVPLFLANVLGVNKSLVGLIEGIAESTASFLKAFSGWFSDRIGRRKNLMALGYGISTLSRPVMAGAAAWQQVLAARFIDRLGKGVRTAPRDAIIAESTKTTHLARAFSFHRAMDTMGAVVGPAHRPLLSRPFPQRLPEGLLGLRGARGHRRPPHLHFYQGKAQRPRLPPRRPKLSFSHFDWRVRFFIVIATVFAMGNSSDVFLILRAQQVGIPAGHDPGRLFHVQSRLLPVGRSRGHSRRTSSA